MEWTWSWSNFAIAIAVFLGIYLMFFLISVLSDMYIVGIALLSALLAYSIQGVGFYPHFLELLQAIGIVDLLNMFGLNLTEQPTTLSISVMCVLIALMGVLLCLPFLPFSNTYRRILGVEKPLSVEETKVKRWIYQEIERLRVRDDEPNDDKREPVESELADKRELVEKETIKNNE